MRIKKFLLFLLGAYLIYGFSPLIKKENCIFLYGGGYSGYWYTLAQLQKYDHNREHFVCYSSACMSLVFSFQNPLLYHAIMDSDKIQQNLIHLSSNVTNLRNVFVDAIITSKIDISRKKITILTTNRIGKCDLNKPQNNTHLRKLLLETTFIPGITGNYDENLENYDGGACLGKPRCVTEVTVPRDYWMWLKTFTPYLSVEDKKYFINL